MKFRDFLISLLFALVSGLVVAFGQPAWSSTWVVGIAPVAAVGGFALFWKAACKIYNLKKRFFLAVAWFAVVQLIQLSWMTSIEFQGFYILVVYGFIALGLGLQFGLLTLLVDRIPFVASASIWVLLEWSRLYVLCGFSFNPVGMALTATPFSLQAVSYFGIFGLSFWVILTNLAVWKKCWKAAALMAILPYLLGAVQWGMHRSRLPESPTLNVALVQTALLPSQKVYFPERASDFISPPEQWSRILQMLSKVKEPLDIVVLPEAAIPYTDQYPLYSKEVTAKIFQKSFPKSAPILAEGKLEKVSNKYWIHALSKVLNADVIVGLDGEEEGRYYSSVFFASPGFASQQEMSRYDKQILLPLAEYLPFQSLKALTKIYGITQFFSHGKESRLFYSKIPISASICYEETFGHILRRGRKEGAALFVNVTNDNWYPHSKLPQQHFDLAKAQAVANGIPLVRACNAGITCALDSLGHEVALLEEWDKPAVLVAKVPLYSISTLYTLWGDQGIIITSIVLLTICAIINRKTLFQNH